MVSGLKAETAPIGSKRDETTGAALALELQSELGLDSELGLG